MPNSIQNKVLDHAEREEAFLTVHLVNGYKIVGKIQSHDDFTVLMTSDDKQVLVYKHAISTITPSVPYVFAENGG